MEGWGEGALQICSWTKVLFWAGKVASDVELWSFVFFVTRDCKKEASVDPLVRGSVSCLLNARYESKTSSHSTKMVRRICQGNS